MNYPIITKKYHFCASHKYGNDAWSEEKNLEVFGKDYNTHGHNYVLEVSVTGPIDPGSGWLVDLPTLNKIVKSKVVDVLDHSQIEKDVEWFKDKQPSSEKSHEDIISRLAELCSSRSALDRVISALRLEGVFISVVFAL